MSRRWIGAIMLIGSLVLSLPAVADHGQGKSHGNPHSKNSAQDGRGGDHDDGRWEVRGDHEYRTYRDRDGRPPGWSRGKKTGWGNCGLPPGQAKKYDCRTYVYQRRRYYYYQDEGGLIIVRRPVIHIHGGVEIH